ncbi:hypothetical protein LCGC14_2077130 [marine sediment metagenome]|uniref:Thioredoxin domain-containing protein n=1 Tax=marine sediment metagenome TaxID=412755 RepID=A0A0F9EGJ2_9ZZZZ|nr:thioredoxin [Candidatus Pacearchaeota archaeon]
MTTVEINKKNFEKEVTDSDIPVIIDFWADWCMPCKIMGPIFEELSNEYGGTLKFCKADVEEELEMASFFKVSSIPTLAIVYQKQVKDKILGSLRKDLLREKIDKILEKIKDGR